MADEDDSSKPGTSIAASGSGSGPEAETPSGRDWIPMAAAVVGLAIAILIPAMIVGSRASYRASELERTSHDWLEKGDENWNLRSTALCDTADPELAELEFASIVDGTAGGPAGGMVSVSGFALSSATIDLRVTFPGSDSEQAELSETNDRPAADDEETAEVDIALVASRQDTGWCIDNVDIYGSQQAAEG